MTKEEVLLLIQTNVVQNNNEEITADVLRPILEEMLNQPNLLVGELEDLGTTDKTSIVAAINELLQDIDDNQGIIIHYGTGNPNDTPPLTFDITDYYVQQSGATVLGMWQWNGNEWAKIENVSGNVVLTIPQILTPAQQEQARENIGVDDFIPSTDFYESFYDVYTYQLVDAIANADFTSGDKFYIIETTSGFYFASRISNIEDFNGSRVYFNAANRHFDLGFPNPLNGYNIWFLGVIDPNDFATTNFNNFNAWFSIDLTDKFLTNTGETNMVALKDDTGVEAVIFKEFDEGTTAYATTAELNTAGFTTANGYVQGFELIMRNTGTYTRYEKMSDSDNDWYFFTNANGWQPLPIV